MFWVSSRSNVSTLEETLISVALISIDRISKSCLTCFYSKLYYYYNKWQRSLCTRPLPSPRVSNESLRFALSRQPSPSRVHCVQGNSAERWDASCLSKYRMLRGVWFQAVWKQQKRGGLNLASYFNMLSYSWFFSVNVSNDGLLLESYYSKAMNRVCIWITQHMCIYL